MRAAAAVALLGICAPAAAGPETRLTGGVTATFVGPECRVRGAAPLSCEPIEQLRVVRGEVGSVQLVLEATSGVARVVVAPVGAEPTPILRVGLERQLFLPVRARSRGRDPVGEALPWTATARPPDDEVLGTLADPLCRAAPGTFEVRPGRREALWVSIAADREGRYLPRVVTIDGAEVALPVEVLAADLPLSPARFFAYVETSELARGGDGEARERARQEVFERLGASGVLPIDQATTADELSGQLRPLRGPMVRDLVVLGAYGTLGAPTDEAVGRVLEMVRLVPPTVRDVVLYAVDEACESDLPERWRTRLALEGTSGGRVRVLLTCGDDPRHVEADVIMTPAERFDPAAAAAARALGREVWVYNGRWPHAGAMALDAPAAGLVWQGWIAARYDVRRWFLWNVDHWSDGNRGGHGPRDPYADPETFHNVDGDAVLLDGLLFFPPLEATLARAAGCDLRAGEPLPSARLARLHRGIQDAALLALAQTEDPAAARKALFEVVPAALAEVPPTASSPEALGTRIARARAQLLDVIARAASDHLVARLSAEQAVAAVAALRPPVAPATPGARLGGGGWSRRAVAAWAGAGAVLTAALAFVAGRWAGRRRARRRFGGDRPAP